MQFDNKLIGVAKASILSTELSVKRYTVLVGGTSSNKPANGSSPSPEKTNSVGVKGFPLSDKL